MKHDLDWGVEGADPLLIFIRWSGIETQALPHSRGTIYGDSILVVMDRRAATLKRLLNTSGR